MGTGDISLRIGTIPALTERLVTLVILNYAFVVRQLQIDIAVEFLS